MPVIIIASSLVSSGAVFVGLWLTGVEFNITAMMGMVMIVGIATEMAIFLVSEYQVLEQTLPPRAGVARGRAQPAATDHDEHAGDDPRPAAAGRGDQRLGRSDAAAARHRDHRRASWCSCRWYCW